MAVFRDSYGHEWSLRFTVGILSQLRAVGFDLAALTKESDRWVEVLFAEPLTLARALWVLCRDEAKAGGISEDAFLAGLDGPTLDAAGDAMIEAIVDFFHRRQAGTIKSHLPAILAKINKTVADATAEKIRQGLSESPGSGQELRG